MLANYPSFRQLRSPDTRSRPSRASIRDGCSSAGCWHPARHRRPKGQSPYPNRIKVRVITCFAANGLGAAIAMAGLLTLVAHPPWACTLKSPVMTSPRRPFRSFLRSASSPGGDCVRTLAGARTKPQPAFPVNAAAVKQSLPDLCAPCVVPHNQSGDALRGSRRQV
jgi:hypothetical protein